MNKISNKYLTFLICLALVLSTLVVFWQVRHHQFISFDDDWYIYNNSHIKTGLTWDNILWAFSHDQGGNYHPLTAMSHMLDCDLYGLDAGGHHFTSLLFHLANALLLFWVLKGMTANLWASAFIAAVFAMHPLHVESVAWASERKDVLSTFFALLTMAAYLRYTRNPGPTFYLLTILLFALGLLAKPMLVTLPFVLLLLDFWPLGRFSNNQVVGNTSQPGNTHIYIGSRWRTFCLLVLEKIPLLALSVILSVVTVFIQKSTGVLKSETAFPLTWRFENAIVAYVTYIIKMLCPVNLAIFYPHPKDGLPLWQVVGASLVLICITAAVIWQFRRRPWLIVGWLWFVGTLIPVIGLVQVGLQAWADRYTYMSYTGLFIIVAWGVPELFARFRYKKFILALVAGASILVLAAAAWFQVGYWQNNEKLYAHAAKVVKDNWGAHSFLGCEFANQGRFDQAAAQFNEALRIDPDNASVKNDLGDTLLKQGKVEEAAELYQKLLPPLPEDINFIRGAAAELSRQRRLAEVVNVYTEAHMNLGMAFLQQDKIDQAIKHFAVVLGFKPEFAITLKDQAGSFLQQGKLKNAEKLYQQILQILPEDLDVHNGLGIALAQQRRFDDAVKHFEKAVTIEPNSSDSHCNLGFALFCAGHLEEAELHFTEAVRLSPGLSAAHFHLGNLFQLQGRLNRAVQEFRCVLQTSPDRADIMDKLARFLAVSKDAEFYDPNQAVTLAQRACELSNFQQPEFLDTLAIAYAAAGRFQDAVETADKAFKLAQSSQKEQLAIQIQARLNLYKAGQPYIESATKTPVDTRQSDSNAAP